MVIEICDDEGTKVCLSDSAKISTLSLRKTYNEKTWCVSFHAISAFVGEVRQEKAVLSILLKYSCEGNASRAYNELACSMGLQIT